MGRITLMDGASGTSLWNMAEMNGVEKAPVWMYNITHPEFVRALALQYLDAGSEIIQANTFGANGPAVRHYKGFDPQQVVKEGVRIVREALQGTGARTAFSIGPLMGLLEPYGDIEEDECRAVYDEMIAAGMSEKPDLIVLETFMDVEMMRIAAEAAKQYDVPVFCSMTFEKNGRTMMGNTVDRVIETLEPLGIAGIGMNCSVGPDTGAAIIRMFSEKTKLPLVYKPNAGLPAAGGEGVPFNAVTFADEVSKVFDAVSYVGGCCGSDPEYIKELRKRIG